MDEIVGRIIETFDNRGNEKYGKEGVTQLEHAVQCAQLAVKEGAADSLVTAALLHDIGHILSQKELPTSLDENFDDLHEKIGYAFLKDNFGDAVADPVRLHVAAKRYLCTKDESYQQKLSPTSYKSFLDQGGMMSVEEVNEFEREKFYEDSLKLRRWDDIGKDPTAPQQDIREYLPQIKNSLAAHSSAS